MDAVSERVATLIRQERAKRGEPVRAAVVETPAPLANPESRELAIPEAGKRSPYELLEGIHDSLATQIAQGEVIPFTFSATESVTEVKALDPLKPAEHRHIPWQTVQIYNDGPATVQVAVNYPHRGWHSLLINETYTIDNTKAKRKVESLYFRTAAGASASGRGIGKY